MDDHILTNHISIVASHFNTIFDESIKKILPSDTKKETASKIPGQKGGRKEKPWNFPCWYSSPASPTYSTCRGLIKLPGHIQKQEQVKTKAFRLLSGLKAPAYLPKVLFFRKPVRVQIQVHTYKLKKIHVTCLSFKHNPKHASAAWQTHAKEPCFSRFLVMFQLLPSLNILKELHTMPKNQLSSQSSQCDVNSQVSQNPTQRVSLRWGRTSARETSTLPANDIVVTLLWWSAPKTWLLLHPTPVFWTKARVCNSSENIDHLFSLFQQDLQTPDSHGAFHIDPPYKLQTNESETRTYRMQGYQFLHWIIQRGIKENTKHQTHLLQKTKAPRSRVSSYVFCAKRSSEDLQFWFHRKVPAPRPHLVGNAHRCHTPSNTRKSGLCMEDKGYKRIHQVWYTQRRQLQTCIIV